MLKIYKPICTFSLMLGLSAQGYAKAPEHPSKPHAPQTQHPGKENHGAASGHIQDKLKELKERIQRLKEANKQPPAKA